MALQVCCDTDCSRKYACVQTEIPRSFFVGSLILSKERMRFEMPSNTYYFVVLRTRIMCTAFMIFGLNVLTISSSQQLCSFPASRSPMKVVPEESYEGRILGTSRGQRIG